MTHRNITRTLLLALACGAGAAQAQIPNVSAGAKGLGLPDVSSVSAGNAAGVLGYCVKNKYLSGGDATSVMNGLMKKPDVESSSDYKAGQAGQLQTGTDSVLSLDSVQKEVKTKTCNMVLKHARSLL